MKKETLTLMFTVVAIALMAFANIETPKEKGFNKSFAEVLRSAKAYTLEVAETMPEADYSFKPSDSVKTFGEQIAHIGMSTQLLHSVFIKGEEMKMDPAEGAKLEKEMGQSKQACIDQINKAFDTAIVTLENMSDKELQETFVFFFAPDKPELTKESGYLFLRDHVTHHRAQAITYLRIKGQVPPSYRPF